MRTSEQIREKVVEEQRKFVAELQGAYEEQLQLLERAEMAIATAEASATTTGKYLPHVQYATLKSTKRRAGIQLTNLHQQLSGARRVLRSLEGKTDSVSEFFMDVAREQLPPETFSGLLATAKAMADESAT